MSVLTEIQEEIIVQTQSAESYISEEELINQELDFANETKNHIDAVNQIYLNIFDIMGRLFETPAELSDSDKLVAKRIVESLSVMIQESISYWNTIHSSGKIISTVCKPNLIDLRINIRNLKEDLNLIEKKYINEFFSGSLQKISIPKIS